MRGDRRVVAMDAEPSLDISVTTGCMAHGPRAMRTASRVTAGKRSDLMSDLVPELLKRKARVAAYYTTGLWYDVGTIATYEKLNSEITDESLSFTAPKQSQKRPRAA